MPNDHDVISTKNARFYQWGEGCDGWHLVASKDLSVIQERVPPGCSEVRHSHKYSEQFFYILDGIATLEVDEVEHVLNPNEGMHVPCGVPHQLINSGDSDLHFLVTSTPPSHGDRVTAPDISSNRGDE